MDLFSIVAMPIASINMQFIMLTDDDDNDPSSIGRSRIVMHSASTSSSPGSGNLNVAHLADGSGGNNASALLSVDEVAIIFGFLDHADIMRARVCATWREAAKKTLVPPTEFYVDCSERSYNAMRVMSTALPNLQQITLGGPRGRDENVYSNGEDPNEIVAQRTANFNSHDINIISNFTKVHAIHICGAPLNGRYDSLFSFFPLLQKLNMQYLDNLKWDLEMLSGLPLLKELYCEETHHLTGNLRSLRVLKETLEKVCITRCPNVGGNFMKLADLCLKKLDLRFTAVTGDIRDICKNDFRALELESLHLPATVRGGVGYRFRLVAEVPDYMHTIHQLLRRTPMLFGGGYLFDAFHWSLSPDSPDWYAYDLRGLPAPFRLQFVQAGSRLGWCWCTHRKDYDYDDKIFYSCEINWLDPEPSIGSIDYANYIYDLQRIEEHTVFCRGYFQPPTELQYRRLSEELA